MSNFSISAQPPPYWDEVCARNDLLFHSRAWIILLEASFHVRTQYIWDETARCGGAVTSFSAGPFQLGYLGFPYGGVIGGGTLDDAVLDEWRSLRSQLLPVAIRIPASAFAEPVASRLSFDATPETAIIDLPSWTLDVTSGNHRRDVKKAQRSVLQVTDANQAEEGARIFEIYLATVKRHRGGLRYNKAYFCNLIDLARSNPNLRVLLARLNDEIAGFTVVVRHGSVACYLHGGMHLEYRAYQPSTLLLNEAIAWAKGLGCECFNLMSSPADQPSLVWYKEKWGAETREHRTYTLPLRTSYRLFQVAERFYRLVR